jgi:TRAP-type mannitol/chloroaromatic compound transport system permease small subunit
MKQILDKFFLLTAMMLLFLVVLIVYDALSRYFFSNGSVALQELEWHLFDLVILLSIAYTFRMDSHVRVDIFYANYTKKYQLLVDILSTLLFIIPFSILIIYIGFDFTMMSFVQDEASSNPGGLTHRWIVKSLMPLAFVFLALEAISLLYKKVGEFRTL